MAQTLSGKVALVAGATRGAGRAIAVELGARGATVYCTGRSVRGKTAMAGRPECIEDTAALVTRAGGRGIHAQVDHTQEPAVKALMERIQREAGRLDLLVNDVWGGEELVEFGKPFWELDMDKVHTLLNRAVFTHMLTARYAVPLMMPRKAGLIVEVTDGDTLHYRMQLAYDLVKTAVVRLAYGMAEELKPHGITSLAVTPGFLRSEFMLSHFGVTEANWKDAIQADPHFVSSETPAFVARGIACLAEDARVFERTGGVYASWTLSDAYGFTDADGTTPHWGRYCEKTFGGNPLGKPQTGWMWRMDRV